MKNSREVTERMNGLVSQKLLKAFMAAADKVAEDLEDFGFDREEVDEFLKHNLEQK